MSEWAQWLLPVLCRCSLLMLVAMLVIRLLQPHSPRWCRILSVVVILQGWLIAPRTLEIPWHDAPARVQVSRQSAVSIHQVLGPTSKLPAERADEQKSEADSSAFTFPVSADRTASHSLTTLRLGLLWAWLVGILILPIAVAAHCHRFRRKLREQCEEGFVQDCQWDTLLKSRGVTKLVPMKMTVNAGPMLCRLQGNWCLLVPRAFWEQCNSSERKAIMQHELSHYLRRDVQKLWCLGVLALPYWFHPAVWWALSLFRESGEYLCDQDAVDTPASKRDYLHALGRLAENRAAVPAMVGHCVHAHPLLLRMRRMLDGSPYEDSMMKRIVLAGMALLLVLFQSVRIELVAQSANNVPPSIQAVKDRMDSYEQQIESLKELETTVQEHIENLKQSVDVKVEELNALRQNPDQLSEEGRRRGKLFLTGGEPEQMEAIKDIAQHLPRDEAVLLCGYVAKQSEFFAVRQAAIKAAASLGKDGFPAFAIAYESLGTEDRTFLVEQTREFEPADRAAIFALIAKEADEELLSKIISEPFADDRRLVLLGAIAKSRGDSVIAKVIQEGAKIEGQQGMLILYAAAGSKVPEHVLAALEAVRPRGKDALPILGAAGKCKDPKVRSQIVRIAKEIGGEEGDFIIEQALAEKAPELKQAAENALTP